MPIQIEYAQCQTGDFVSIPIETYSNPNATNTHGGVFDTEWTLHLLKFTTPADHTQNGTPTLYSSVHYEYNLIASAVAVETGSSVGAATSSNSCPLVPRRIVPR
mmetsp:Transcript_6925/g.7956  ORF Transcript_6925/g.7956 Transcript_6925/m.7956 type:complete len:104 (-) Transcript_6925:281-592(-)